MLQTNLIFGIQKKIKESKVGKTLQSNILEETTANQAQAPIKNEVLLENYYNPSIASGIYEQVKDSQKKTETKKTLVMEAFHLSKVEKKLSKDISYFNYLFENFVEDFFKDDYQMLLESIFEDTIKLYQECDVTPRIISPAIESNELTESQVVDLYKNSLNHAIKVNYTKPLLSGKINELYESEMKNLTKKLIEEGVSADVDQIKIYLPFEETIYRFNREVMIPKLADTRIQAYMESTTSEYNDLLEESADDLMKIIEQKMKLLSSMIAPGMFEKAVDAEGVDAPKMAGISITVDDNFADAPEDCDDTNGPCPAEAAMDPEAAKEMEAEDEASSIDAAGEDIVKAEEQARGGVDLATDVDDLESTSQENQAELSGAESSDEDDQPGAIEKDLPMENGTKDKDGYANNDSDVALQGQGKDNGEDAGSTKATLPGSPVAGATTDISSDGATDVGLSGSGNDDGVVSATSASLPSKIDTTSSADTSSEAAPEEITPLSTDTVGTTAGGGSGGYTTNTSDASLSGKGNDNGVSTGSGASLPSSVSSGSSSTSVSSVSSDTGISVGSTGGSAVGNVNDGDQGLSSGSGTAKSGGISSEEIVGADGDDSNAILGVSAEAPEVETATDTPSEDQMNAKEESGMAIPSL